jgi:hypothetical protein
MFFYQKIRNYSKTQLDNIVELSARGKTSVILYIKYSSTKIFFFGTLCKGLKDVNDKSEYLKKASTTEKRHYKKKGCYTTRHLNYLFFINKTFFNSINCEILYI